MGLGFTTAERVQVAVAVASGAVAFATFFLGWKTRRMAIETKRVAEATEGEAKAVADQAQKVATQAAAAEEQARIGAAALQASIRPWLTRPEESDCIRVYSTMKGEGREIELWLRNVGTGIALIPPEGCTVRGGGRTEGTLVERTGVADQPALPPKEVVRIRFQIAGNDFSADDFFGRPRVWGYFHIFVTYADVNGEQPVRATLRLTAANPEATEWRLHMIDYARVPETTSFTSVEFDARFE